MTDMPKAISIKEEGPREGFQIEKADIPTARKIALVDALSETGVKQIQLVSFVNPKRVPGMADADDVVRGFKKKPGVDYSALFFNNQGFERALSFGDRLTVKGALPLCASETFLKRNQNRTMQENIAALHEQVEMYKARGVPVQRGSVMAAFGCNFEGEVPPQRVVGLVGQIFEIAAAHDLDIKEIALADTMGWATPLAVKRLVGAVRERFPNVRINLHLHDTRGMGHRQCLCRAGDGRRQFRQLGGRARRLSVRAPQGRRRQCLHRGPGVPLRRDGHRDRHRSRAHDRGGAAGAGDRRASAARPRHARRNLARIAGEGAVGGLIERRRKMKAVMALG